MATIAHLPAWAEQYSFAEYRAGKTTHYIGKCRQCKQAVRVDITQMKQLFDHPVKGLMFLYDYSTSVKAYSVKSQGKLTWSTACPTNNCCFPHSSQPSMIGLKPIDGYVNEAKKCDPRCTGATGHTCECSCGGENHGADHAI